MNKCWSKQLSQQHWGIFTEDSQSPFIFTYTENKSFELVSSLQAFETSLIMIALGRWTNAVVSLTNASEIITRRQFGRSGTYREQVEEFCKKHSLSRELAKAADESAKKRNKYTHQSTIPKDNSEAIKTYFSQSLSVYKLFLEAEFSLNIYDLIWDEDLCKNLKFARDFAKKHKEGDGHIGYDMAVIVKTISNLIYGDLMPEISYYHSLGHASADDKKWEEYLNAQFSYGDALDGDAIHPEDNPATIKCPCSCEGLLSIEISHDIPEEFIDSAKCCHCGILLIGKTLLNQYVISQISSAQKSEILKSYGF